MEECEILTSRPDRTKTAGDVDDLIFRDDPDGYVSER